MTCMSGTISHSIRLFWLTRFFPLCFHKQKLSPFRTASLSPSCRSVIGRGIRWSICTIVSWILILVPIYALLMSSLMHASIRQFSNACAKAHLLANPILMIFTFHFNHKHQLDSAQLRQKQSADLDDSSFTTDLSFSFALTSPHQQIYRLSFAGTPNLFPRDLTPTSRWSFFKIIASLCFAPPTSI
jgi:hypothetical protein